MSNYFFNSNLSEQSPYFLLPAQMLRFNEHKRGVLKIRKGSSCCEKSYFGIPVESQSNKHLISSLLRSDVEQLKFDRVKLPSVLHITNTIADCSTHNIRFTFSANRFNPINGHLTRQLIQQSSDVVDGTILANQWII